MITATLFLVFAVITILGMPIALALVGGGMAAIVAGDLMPLFTSVQKMFSSVDSFTLAAIPFFMLAGALMSSGGISRRLIDFANAAVGWMPGGLGVVTIFSCMLFGCLCGSPTATVAANGCIGGQYVHGRNCSRHHAGRTDDCLCDFLRRKKSDP